MPVALIPAARVHAELLAAMHKVCFAAPWSVTAMGELLAMPGAAGLIAVAEDSLVPAASDSGPCGLVLWRAAGGEAEVLTIAVLPPWRRAGIGARLLDAAMAGARAAGAEAMFLEVADGNAAAQALYAGHGFAAVGRRRGYYAGGDAVVMRCGLLAPDGDLV